MSDALRFGLEDNSLNKFNSLQMTLFFGPVFTSLSFVTFLFAAIYVEEDKKKVDDLIEKN